MFSGRQPRQYVKVFWHFRDWLRPHLQGLAGGLVESWLMTKYPIVFSMGAGWNATPLVRGGSQQSLHFTWASYCWLWRALHNQQSTAQAKCNDLLTPPTNQRGCILYHTCAEQRYTQHRVGHLVISFGTTKPPATPWTWGWSQSLKHRKTIKS